ncbi:YcxB family protein [Caenimonas sp. DR4.4]|uniref:YcxB family protein n=1 Tax=Caenimonas aquaedulcis TaxID=2793270 RepID=A0A931H835_9BURK|nr:YcxB family protein [Caenimonas aquaedulcis]
MAATLCYLVARGDRSWFVGVLAATVALGGIFPAVHFVLSLRSSLRKLTAMRNPEASFRADADSFSIASELGSATLPWTAVQQLWRYQDFWIIVLARTSQITLPLARMTQEDQAFVVSRVAANGGKVGT